MGSLEEKVKAIERVDGVVGTIRDRFEGVIAVLPDHPTPIRVKTHTRDPVPFVVTGKDSDGSTVYSEAAGRSWGLSIKNAPEFLEFLFG